MKILVFLNELLRSNTENPEMFLLVICHEEDSTYHLVCHPQGVSETSFTVGSFLLSYMPGTLQETHCHAYRYLPSLGDSFRMIAGF